MRTYAIASPLFLALLVAGLLLALLAPTGAQGAARTPLSAGVGLDNRAPHPEYPLKMVFATTKGHYLADIQVTLLDASGKEVAKAHAKGPWLFLDVPAGTYTVKALRSNGDMATARIEVGGGQQAVLRLTWKAGM